MHSSRGYHKRHKAHHKVLLAEQLVELFLQFCFLLRWFLQGVQGLLLKFSLQGSANLLPWIHHPLRGGKRKKEVTIPQIPLGFTPLRLALGILHPLALYSGHGRNFTCSCKEQAHTSFKTCNGLNCAYIKQETWWESNTNTALQCRNSRRHTSWCLGKASLRSTSHLCNMRLFKKAQFYHTHTSYHLVALPAGKHLPSLELCSYPWNGPLPTVSSLDSYKL